MSGALVDPAIDALLRHLMTSVTKTTSVQRSIVELDAVFEVNVRLPPALVVTHAMLTAVLAVSKRIERVTWHAPNALVVRIVRGTTLPVRAFPALDDRPRVRPLDFEGVRPENVEAIDAVERLFVAAVDFWPTDARVWLQHTSDEFLDEHGKPMETDVGDADDDDSDSDESSSSSSIVNRLPSCTCYSLVFQGMPNVRSDVMALAAHKYPNIDAMQLQCIGTRPGLVVTFRESTCTAAHSKKKRRRAHA